MVLLATSAAEMSGSSNEEDQLLAPVCDVRCGHGYGGGDEGGVADAFRLEEGLLTVQPHASRGCLTRVRTLLATTAFAVLAVACIRTALVLQRGDAHVEKLNLERTPSIQANAVLLGSGTRHVSQARAGQIKHRSGRCLSLPRLEAGAEAHLWTCLGKGFAPSQSWKYDADGGHIRNMYGFCMDTYDDRPDLWFCSTRHDRPKWELNHTEGMFNIHKDGKCLDVEPGSAKVHMEECNGKHNGQNWRMTTADENSFAQIWGEDGQCLHMVDPRKSGSPISFKKCLGQQEATTQQWTYDHASGHIQIGQNLCLQAKDPHTVASAIHTAVCSEGEDQRWRLHGAGQIASAAGGLCLDAQHPRADGADIRLQVCNEDSGTQQWSVPSPPQPPQVAQANASGVAAFQITPAGASAGAPKAAPAAKEAVPAAPASAAPAADACLCLFDVDRTLTGKQGVSGPQCPGNKVFPGVQDPAFAQGDLTLSALGQGMSKTFCGKCHLGIISAGAAGGDDEKQLLRAALTGASELPNDWSGPNQVTSPMVFGCPDAQKSQAARGVVQWYAEQRNVHVKPENVHFFDDHTGNTGGFAALGYNARQISCATRDASIGDVVGVCGAALAEIVPGKGTFNCR